VQQDSSAETNRIIKAPPKAANRHVVKATESASQKMPVLSLAEKMKIYADRRRRIGSVRRRHAGPANYTSIADQLFLSPVPRLLRTNQRTRRVGGIRGESKTNPQNGTGMLLMVRARKRSLQDKVKHDSQNILAAAFSYLKQKTRRLPLSATTSTECSCVQLLQLQKRSWSCL
jgi:hypothetical protein